jgi:hypothetical protein
VLTDTARIPALLRGHGVLARVGRSFGAETLPPGLRVITGHKPAGQPGAQATWTERLDRPNW